MSCAYCPHSVKANVMWMWLCGYGQSLKAGEKYDMRVLLCEAGKLPEKPKWCPLGAVGPEKIQG